MRITITISPETKLILEKERERTGQSIDSIIEEMIEDLTRIFGVIK